MQHSTEPIAQQELTTTQAQEPLNVIDHTATTDTKIALFDQEVSLKTNANSMAMVDYGN